MGALGSLGIGLSVLFGVFLAVLLGEICYMLCCRRSSSSRRHRPDSRRVNSVHVVEALSRDAAFVGSFGAAVPASSSASTFPSSSSSFSASSDFLPVSKFFASGLFPIAEETKEDMMDLYCMPTPGRDSTDLSPVGADEPSFPPNRYRGTSRFSPGVSALQTSGTALAPSVSSFGPQSMSECSEPPRLGSSTPPQSDPEPGTRCTFVESESSSNKEAKKKAYSHSDTTRFGGGAEASSRSERIRFGWGGASLGTAVLVQQSRMEGDGSTPFTTPPTSPESASSSISPVTAASRLSVMSASPPSASSSPAVGGGGGWASPPPPGGWRFSPPADSPEHGPLGYLLFRRVQQTSARFSPLRPARFADDYRHAVPVSPSSTSPELQV